MATISTSSSQVDIVDQSLLSGALHLPVASRSIRCGKALRQRSICLPLRASHVVRPTGRALRPFHLISTSSKVVFEHRAASSRRAACGFGAGARCGLHDAHASVYVVP